MSYKKGLDKFTQVLINAAKEGKTAKLLVNSDTIHYKEVREHISIVEGIEKEALDNGMSYLTLRFAENKTVNTYAFVDDTIQIGDIVSTIGYFSKDYTSISYCCKGGINKIVNRANQFDYFLLYRIYRMGIVTELSKVEISADYLIEDGITALKGVEGFYYKIMEPDSEAKRIKDKLDQMRNAVATKGVTKAIDTSAFANLEDDTDDYPDVTDSTELTLSMEPQAETEIGQKD